ncbi:MAG: ABC transporter substrate-binding protein, partial [Roseburia sp.]|nr:ABC transporter substrate-binding protein [Roseburia sp.]
YVPTAETYMGGEGILQIVEMSTPVVTNTAARGSIFGIYEKCENPDKAYEFLKLWNTDPEVKNAILYGIPDVHYTLVDGQVQYVIEDNMAVYNAGNWCTGNVIISYTTVNEPKDKYERYDAFNSQAVAAADLGINYDYSAIEAKVTTCNAVLQEYLPPLLYGFVEPESGLAQLQEQLVAAGINEVIEELNAQYQAFKAAN